MHLIRQNNWIITSYKTVTIATRTLARIDSIISHFHCWSYIAPLQGIWNYSDNCCHGYHEKMYFYWILVNLVYNKCISLVVSMTTNLIEVPCKYFDKMTWNMIFFIQKMQFLVFFQILHKIYEFFNIIKICC